MLIQILLYGHGRDQGIYSVVARTVLEGGMPYRDAWDFKPPGIFLVYAVARAVFGSGEWPIRALEVLGVALTCLGLVELTRRHWNNTQMGLMAAVIMTFAHAQLDFWHTSQPESFGGMLTIAALLFAPRPNKATTNRDWFVAGCLFGIAGLLKPPLAGGAIVPLLVHAWTNARSTDPPAPWKATLRAMIRPTLMVAAGGATPIVLCLLWFAARGALGDLYRVLFVFTPHYTALGWKDATVTGMCYYAFTEWLQHYGSVPTVGLLLALGFGIGKKERPFTALVLGIVAMHLIGVAMQGKFFPYHYGATWPLTAIVAAFGYFRLWGVATSRRARIAYGVFIVIVVFCRSATKDVPDSYLTRTKKRVAVLAGGLRDQRTLDELASIADVSAVRNRAVADLLREKVPDDRSVYVWGFEPQIYDMSGRKAASRYIYNVAQRVEWAKHEHRAVLMDELQKNPPAAIVVERHDVFPMVTGNALGSADSLKDFDALKTLIDEKYTHLTTIHDMDVFIERQ
ncbi:MAG: glycosyltransferase family 39 protein [Polyangiaceae bacterium]|nr:glycosyltransferase family 39 protein [Polyangiaceae bacterium]